MARYPKITLSPHLSTAELKARYRACADPREARRWHALWLFCAGNPIGAVADLVGMHRNWIRTVITRYNAQGADAVVDQHTVQPGGRQPYLDTANARNLHRR